VGFTNEITVAVWVGYDNGNGRRTLGGGATGGHVAAPIFKPIVEAVWNDYAKQAPLAPPSAEAKRQIALLPVDPASGNRLARGQGGITEAFRIDASGRIDDTQYRIVSQSEAETAMVSRDDPDQQGNPQQGFQTGYPYGQPTYNNGAYRGQPQAPSNPFFGHGGLFGSWANDEQERQQQYQQQLQQQQQQQQLQQQRRRVDPDYFWNNRTN
jgi:membrane peptidoglycan carboxypeptidase